MAWCRRAIGIGVLLLAGVGASRAQEIDRPPPGPPPLDLAAPSLPEPPATQEGTLEAPVTFSASDSLVIQFRDEGDLGRLSGQAGVAYKDASLSAFHIDILFDSNELRASGVETDSGAVGRPTFTQGSESFQGDRLAFNLGTERGRVEGAQTVIPDGVIQASVVKVYEDSTIHIRGGAYTTCECVDDPSYSLRASRMKIVDQAWIFTGPIQLYLFNVPTPLWLPFGFLPAREGRRSGPLSPQYGEDERGFYLRNWGWYQAINDHMDTRVQFGIWTKGSWQVSPQFRYAKRYAHSGQIAVDYLRNRSGERGDPDFSAFDTGRIRWTHNQEMSPTARFNANVDLSSSNYLRTSSEQYDDRVRQTIQSNLGFGKTWRRSGRNVSFSASHRQSLASGSVQAVLPSLSFRQGTRRPFEREGTGKDRWYERITYDYSLNVHNRYRFNPREGTDVAWYEALFSPSKYREATGDSEPFEFKTSHRVNVGAGFPIHRRFPVHVVPNVSYTEDWFIRTERRRLDEDSSLVIEAVPDFLALRQFTTSVSANTTFYGIFPIRIGPYRGLRHTVRPSVSVSYRPDFFDESWGYTREYVDADGVSRPYALVDGVQRFRQQSMGMSIDNVFESRRLRSDSTGVERSDTIRLLNVGLSTSYRFAADSMRLGNLRMNARTRLANQFQLNVGTTLSPYALNADGTRLTGRYLFNDRPLNPMRLTMLRISLNASFEGGRTGPQRAFGDAVPERSPLGGEGFPGSFPMAGVNVPGGYPGGRGGLSSYPTDYTDFSIPWSIRLDLSYQHSKPLARSTTTATLNAQFDFNLTPYWKVQGRSGYDFQDRELVYTSLSIFRDLDCWELGVRWVPFGPYQSYSVDLRVKSGHLRDILRLRQPREDVRGRFGRLLN